MRGNNILGRNQTRIRGCCTVTMTAENAGQVKAVLNVLHRSVYKR